MPKSQNLVPRQGSPRTTYWEINFKGYQKEMANDSFQKLSHPLLKKKQTHKQTYTHTESTAQRALHHVNIPSKPKIR